MLDHLQDNNKASLICKGQHSDLPRLPSLGQMMIDRADAKFDLYTMIKSFSLARQNDLPRILLLCPRSAAERVQWICHKGRTVTFRKGKPDAVNKSQLKMYVSDASVVQRSMYNSGWAAAATVARRMWFVQSAVLFFPHRNARFLPRRAAAV